MIRQCNLDAVFTKKMTEEKDFASAPLYHKGIAHISRGQEGCDAASLIRTPAPANCLCAVEIFSQLIFWLLS